MPQLRRGRRREQARRAGRPGPGPLWGGAHRSEAPAFAPPRPDAAGDRAWLQQPPPSPPPPPGGPSKSLDLGEGAALSGIAARAGRRPREPLQFQKLSPEQFVILSWLFDGNGSCTRIWREENQPGTQDILKTMPMGINSFLSFRAVFRPHGSITGKNVIT
ncbi:AP-4 complex accessory subunit RUSC1-like [Pongo abelii]|uniref:AP-4 complex accessory subunit RUSC1-like n=1 Tax=Pongo abelii TaxID=9601 RepID=UPI0030045FF3